MYRGNWAGGRLNPGHGIGETDVAAIRAQLLGLPITVEHEGNLCDYIFYGNLLLY